MKVLVRMRKSHALRLVPGVNCSRKRRARIYVSCTRSSASASDGVIRRGGLGPTKAVRIRAMLREIRDGGVTLDDRAFTAMKDQDLWDALVALPGVGPKTAACVLLFSLDRPYFPVDTHVHRVAIRLGLVPPRSDAVATQAAFQESVPDDDMYALHMNLIRHGREVCTAQRPRCSECVLNDLCPRIGVTSSR